MIIPRDTFTLSARIVVCLTVTGIFFSAGGCVSPPVGPSGITVLDFQSQNMERLHSGIARLVGEDSAGLAAMEYVLAYEEDLVKYFPADRLTEVPGDPETTVLEESWWVLKMKENEYFLKQRAMQGIARSGITEQQFLQFLTGRRLRAMADLRKSSDEFTMHNTPETAKMGLVAAYVAVGSAPSPSEIKIVTDAVGPMLGYLTSAGRSPTDAPAKSR